MKKLLFVVALLGLSVPALAQKGGISTKNIDWELRTVEAEFKYNVPSGTTVGQDGTVGFMTLNGIVNASMTDTSSAAQLMPGPYPCKLDVVLNDASANDVMTCASVVIKGYNQFNEFQSETVRNVRESISRRTAGVYERVVSVAATCDGASDVSASDAGDGVVLNCSVEAGLPRKIRRNEDVLSVCYYDESAPTSQWCYDSDSEASVFDVDLIRHAIDFDDTSAPFTFADGDKVKVRVRPRRGF